MNTLEMLDIGQLTDLESAIALSIANAVAAGDTAPAHLVEQYKGIQAELQQRSAAIAEYAAEHAG